jgi:hypothetical protein
MDLMDDEPKDEVRLQLPLSIGSRYGPAPDTLATASTPSSQTSLCITVYLQMSGTIRQVTSPTLFWLPKLRVGGRRLRCAPKVSFIK